MSTKKYKVEAVTGHRFNEAGELEFLIRWFNYAESTWEPYQIKNKNGIAGVTVVEEYRKRIKMKTKEEEEEEGMSCLDTILQSPLSRKPILLEDGRTTMSS